MDSAKVKTCSPIRPSFPRWAFLGLYSSCFLIKMSRNSLLFKQPGGATPGLKHAAEKREEVADSLSVFHSSRALNGALLGATDAASCESYWLRPQTLRELPLVRGERPAEAERSCVRYKRV